MRVRTFLVAVALVIVVSTVSIASNEGNSSNTITTAANLLTEEEAKDKAIDYINQYLFILIQLQP